MFVCELRFIVFYYCCCWHFAETVAISCVFLNILFVWCVILDILFVHRFSSHTSHPLVKCVWHYVGFLFHNVIPVIVGWWWWWCRSLCLVFWFFIWINMAFHFQAHSTNSEHSRELRINFLIARIYTSILKHVSGATPYRRIEWNSFYCYCFMFCMLMFGSVFLSILTIIGRFVLWKICYSICVCVCSACVVDFVSMKNLMLLHILMLCIQKSLPSIKIYIFYLNRNGL